MNSRQWDPQHRGELVQRAERAVAGQPIEHRGAQRDSGHQGDRKSRVRAEACDAGQQPEELVGGHDAYVEATGSSLLGCTDGPMLNEPPMTPTSELLPASTTG